MPDNPTPTPVPAQAPAAAVPQRPAAPAQAPKTKPYRVLLGKHYLGKDKEGTAQYAKQGDIVQLTAEQANRFKGKFGPAGQATKEDSDEEVETEGKAKGQTQAPAQA